MQLNVQKLLSFTSMDYHVSSYANGLAAPVE